MAIGPATLLGYHTYSSCDYDELQNYRFMNVTNALGAIPGIGAIIGFMRILMACVNQNLNPKAKALMVIRGIVEFVGAGILFFIVDLIVSINRHCCNSSSAQSEVRGLQGG